MFFGGRRNALDALLSRARGFIHCIERISDKLLLTCRVHRAEEKTLEYTAL